MAVVGAFEQGVGEVAFVGVELEAARFDGVLGHQPVKGHRALLADTMAAVAPNGWPIAVGCQYRWEPFGWSVQPANLIFGISAMLR